MPKPIKALWKYDRLSAIALRVLDVCRALLLAFKSELIPNSTTPLSWAGTAGLKGKGLEEREENSTLVSKISRLQSDPQEEQPRWRKCPSQLDDNSLLKIIHAPKMAEFLKSKKLTGLLDSERALITLGHA